MSYDIIKSISVKNNQIFVTSACSNVFPKTYSRGMSPSLTEILAEEGREQLDSVILKEFRNGNFQGMSTLYAKALHWQANQPKKGVHIADGDLLETFKQAWNAKAPLNVFYKGAGVVKVGKARFTFNYNNDKGKEYPNIARAEFALRSFSQYKDGFEFRIIGQLKAA